MVLETPRHQKPYAKAFKCKSSSKDLPSMVHWTGLDGAGNTWEPLDNGWTT